MICGQYSVVTQPGIGMFRDKNKRA